MATGEFRNTVIRRQTDNSLKEKNALLRIMVVGLSIASALSVGSCAKNANNLRQVRSANADLKDSVRSYQKDAADKTQENEKLKEYAETAQSFALGIRPWSDENDSGCEDPNCPQCKKMEEENAQKVKNFEKACKDANINEEMLTRLQRGWDRE